MSLRKFSDIETIDGLEGAKIRQIFHPHNTLNGIRYSIAHFTLKTGEKSVLHKMKTSEVYFVLEGKATLHVDDDEISLEKNDSVYVPPMAKQFIENSGDGNLEFLCIVDPAWKQTDEEILENPSK